MRASASALRRFSAARDARYERVQDTPRCAIRRSPMAQQRVRIGAGATTQGACSCGMTCGASSVCGDRTLSLLLARSPGMTRAPSIGAHLSPKFVQDGDTTQRSHTGAWSQERAPERLLRPLHPLRRPSNEPMDSSGPADRSGFQEILGDSRHFQPGTRASPKRKAHSATRPAHRARDT
jgi:hypothetical protein